LIQNSSKKSKNSSGHKNRDASNSGLLGKTSSGTNLDFGNPEKEIKHQRDLYAKNNSTGNAAQCKNVSPLQKKASNTGNSLAYKQSSTTAGNPKKGKYISNYVDHKCGNRKPHFFDFKV
jgi:hypothetical protein